MSDPNHDPDYAGFARRCRATRRKVERLCARRAPRLDPTLWAPPFVPVPPLRGEAYRAMRSANRPFRRAFAGGDLRRRILLKVAESNIRAGL